MIQKPSPMMQKLRNDELVLCAKLNIVNMITAEIAAYAGFDCLWMDMEHVPADYNEVMAAVLAAKENSDLPVVATMVLDQKGKLLTGGDIPAEMDEEIKVFLED